MARFLTPLRVQLLDELDRANVGGGDGQRPVWRLLSPLKFESDILGRVYEVPAGFDTDFASIPRTFLSSLFMGMGNRAAVLHDYAYRTHVLTKDEADDLFLEALTVDDIPGRQGMYIAVKMFGLSSYDPNWQPWKDK